jgi:hypothetical protein
MKLTVSTIKEAKPAESPTSCSDADPPNIKPQLEKVGVFYCLRIGLYSLTGSGTHQTLFDSKILM